MQHQKFMRRKRLRWVGGNVLNGPVTGGLIVLALCLLWRAF